MFYGNEIPVIYHFRTTQTLAAALRGCKYNKQFYVELQLLPVITFFRCENSYKYLLSRRIYKLNIQ